MLIGRTRASIKHGGRALMLIGRMYATNKHRMPGYRLKRRHRQASLVYLSKTSMAQFILHGLPLPIFRLRRGSLHWSECVDGVGAGPLQNMQSMQNIVQQRRKRQHKEQAV